MPAFLSVVSINYVKPHLSDFGFDFDYFYLPVFDLKKLSVQVIDIKLNSDISRQSLQFSCVPSHYTVENKIQFYHTLIRKTLLNLVTYRYSMSCNKHAE